MITMLNYLKIFSWFLLTFGVVGLITLFLGLKPEFGSISAAAGLLVVQILVASSILYGFKLHINGVISRRCLLYGGWGLIICLALGGQIWVTNSGIII